MVVNAPEMQGWKIIALRQPMAVGFVLEYEELIFNTSEMFFYPIIDGNNLDLIIYAKGIDKYDEDTVGLYGLITMDNILEEYDCVMKIRKYDFHDIENEEDKSGLIPLRELRKYIDDCHNKNKIQVN